MALYSRKLETIDRCSYKAGFIYEKPTYSDVTTKQVSFVERSLHFVLSNVFNKLLNLVKWLRRPLSFSRVHFFQLSHLHGAWLLKEREVSVVTYPQYFPFLIAN